jgi:hypothetical protein
MSFLNCFPANIFKGYLEAISQKGFWLQFALCGGKKYCQHNWMSHYFVTYLQDSTLLSRESIDR